MDCTQLGSVQEYVDEFLAISSRLPHLPDSFKQRCFSKKCNSYLREQYAGQQFPSLMEMVRYAMILAASVDEHLLQPDVPWGPVIAAMPVRQRAPFSGECWSCDKQGHMQHQRRAPQRKGASGHDKPGQDRQTAVVRRGSAKFGKYDGSGKANARAVNAVSASLYASDSESEDDKRQGNGLA